jgi:hypothetical protein
LESASQIEGFTRKQLIDQKRKWDIDYRYWSADYIAPPKTNFNKDLITVSNVNI